MKHFLLLIVCIITFNNAARSQYYLPENGSWVVGGNGGADFSTSPPSTFHTSINTLEGCASVCGKEGGLLFYTDGTTVWQASGAIMPNGNNITGTSGTTFSTTQAAVIVPDPNNNYTTIKRYYLFSLSSLSARNLNCNVVDMNLNNGDGDIDLTFPLRNVVLNNSLGEKMIAIRGCNNNVWLIVVKDNQFLSYEINSTGINTTPVISTTNNAGNIYGTGVMKASSDGTKIAACKVNGSALGVLRFDFTTGIVSDQRIVDSFNSSYGCALSPDGNKLYSGDGQGNICQYDLSIPYPAQSKLILGPAMFLDMKLAANGKIYFISTIGGMLGEYMGCINNPDVLGPNCNYQDTVLHFLNGDRAFGLANEVVIAAPLPPAGLNRVILDSFLCHVPSSGNVMLQAAAGFNNYVWDNGTAGTTRSVSQQGNYYVTYTTPCGRRTDTFKIAINSSILGITFNNPFLNASAGYASYKWYQGNTLIPGATNETLSVSAGGWYSVVAVNTHGCVDSASYNVIGFTGINELQLLKNQIHVYPNPSTDIVHLKSPVAITVRLYSIDGKLLLRSENNNDISIKQLNEGLYFLNIADKDGNLIKVEKIVKTQ